MSSISVDGATVTLYIQQIEDGYFYKQNVDGSLTSFIFPLTISNSNDTPTSNILKVFFETNLTLTSVSHFIVIGSSGIQIGDTSVKSDGTRPTITVDVDNYPGFIRNGTGSSDGYANVYVYNLVVDGTGHQTAEGGGWVGQEYFGRSVTDNFIVNCSSYGAISSFGGGILGAECGNSSNVGATELRIFGCTSSGAINSGGGGIVGQTAGADQSSYVSITSCSSSGTIGTGAGGIAGSYAGSQLGLCQVQLCYSTGSIGENAGGIYGQYAGDNGIATTRDSYSRGTIGTDAGGIYGLNAAPNSGTTSVLNCYCIGSGGLYGTGAGEGASTTSSYVANPWSDVAAISAGLDVTTVFVSTATNTPYELRGTGPSPYSLTTIVNNDISLVYNETVAAGGSTIAGVLAGLSSYSILQINDPPQIVPTITINSTTGVISTTTSTSAGEYTILVRAVTNPYSITAFFLTVTGLPAPAPSPTAAPTVVRGKGYDFGMYNDTYQGNVLVRERLVNTNLRFKSFEDYNKYLKSRTSLI